jgi:hypothetical protein
MRNAPRRSRVLAAIACVLLFLAQASFAREAVVTFKDGRTVKGEVVEENDKEVTLLIANVKTPFSRDLIKSVEFVKTVDEEYSERRAKIADDNVTERYELARWLFDKKAYAPAKKELDDLAKRDPKNQEVSLLLKIINDRLKVAPPVTTEGTDTKGTDPKVLPPAGDLPKDRLDQKQINKIRVLELDDTVTPAPRVTVSRPIIDKFLKEYEKDENVPKGAERSKFLAKKDFDKLKLMMQVGAKDLFGEVVVHDDPPAIRDFRNVVHKNYVLTFCATNECHGGPKAGKFFLFNSNPTSAETIHTNFYILTQTKTATSYMVDRDFPERSLLIQYGMPLNTAKTPHPDVPGFKPHFLVGEKDRTYVATMDWIKMLYRPAPRYDIIYKMPSTEVAKPKTPDPVKTAPAPAPPATK